MIYFVVLQGWLYRLEQEGSSQAKLLLDRFVAKSWENSRFRYVLLIVKYI